jgi:hypothetical protein
MIEKFIGLNNMVHLKMDIMPQKVAMELIMQIMI